MSVKAAVIREPKRIRIEQFAKPDLGPSDMLLRVRSAGICGTDVEIYKGLLNEFRLPLIMGHEIVGEVAEAGSEVEELRGLKIGDRVIVEGSMSCGQCMYCRNGQKKHCKTFGNYGLRTTCDKPPFLWGGFSEKIFVPIGANVRKLPDTVPDDTAVLVSSVIANGVQWTSLIGNCRVGDVVVVQGSGPQGIACAAAAQASGAKLIIVTGLARDRRRLELAKKLGAHVTLMVDQCDAIQEVKKLTDGAMADLVIDVTGSSASPQLSLELAKIGGMYVHASQMGSELYSSLILDTLVRKEVTIRGARSKGEEAIKRAFAMAESSMLPFHEMVTHHFALAEISEAFNQLAYADDRPIKAVIHPNR